MIYTEKRRSRVLASRITLLCFFLLMVSAPNVWGTSQAADEISTPDQFKDEFQTVPCKNSERQDAVKTLFEQMGAAASEITVDSHKRVENVMIRRDGTGEGLIVVGAHYDKANNGCGALDNWTGIVAMAHIYRSLKSAPIQKTLLFVAFGDEERGLVGSRAMVDAIKKDALPQYCAMINIDSLGLAPPQVMDNTSSGKLARVAEEIAGKMKIPFAHARIDSGDTDSSSFLNRKIPSVTIHGMSNEWPKVLHTTDDRATRVNPLSVYLGYRLALALVTRVDASPCDAYR